MSENLGKAAQDNRSGDAMAEEDREAVASRLSRVRIVLINTTHPGNIGAAARAMKVMGLSSLHLVTPKIFPNAEATAMASGADDLLQHAVVHDSLDSALKGCPLVLGTSARLRSLSMPMMDARRAAGQALQESSGHEVAVLFGRERYGLTNEEMQRCQFLVNIPSNPEYSSLNLAQAVQIIGYELSWPHWEYLIYQCPRWTGNRWMISRWKASSNTSNRPCSTSVS